MKMSSLAMIAIGIVFTLCLFAVVAFMQNCYHEQKEKLRHNFDEDGLCDLNEKGQPRD